MKLSYKELSDKIVILFKEHKDMTTWQGNLTQLIEQSGWTRQEWDLEVSAKYDLYRTSMTKKLK